MLSYLTQETLIEYCLQALLSHSTVEEQCTEILNSLPLFYMVLKVGLNQDHKVESGFCRDLVIFHL